MRLRLALLLCVSILAAAALLPARQTSPGAGPVIVLDTARGVIEFETYPEDAPRTVAHIIGLVKSGFYDGLRFHRAEPAFGLVQIGDPQSRNMLLREWWGRAASGKAIGAAEVTKRRRHARGAVAMAYPGTDPRSADSQFFINLKPHPEWDARYTVFGQVITGIDVADALRPADEVRKAFVREAPAVP